MGPRAQRVLEPCLEIRARDRVERGEGLIQAEHLSPGEHRACERDALAHAGRQLVRSAALESAETKLRKRRRRGRARRRAIDAGDP